MKLLVQPQEQKSAIKEGDKASSSCPQLQERGLGGTYVLTFVS